LTKEIFEIALNIIIIGGINLNITKLFFIKFTVSIVIFVFTLNMAYIETSSKEDLLNRRNDLEKEILSMLKSGPETNFPWDFELEFIKAKEDNNTPILMGGYRTVLKDPLPGEELNVHLAAKMLSGTIIMPGQVFSQNKTIGPYTEEKGFKKGPTYIGSKLSTTIGGGVCKIASTLYNVTVLSNLEVIERHNHSMPVPYVPYGQDATVSYGAKDYKFKNNTDHPVMIWAQGIENILYMGFYGSDVPPSITWNHEVLEVRKADKIYNINSDLPYGNEKIITEGMDGAVIKSNIIIQDNDGKTTYKNMGTSNYIPFPFLVEKSSE